MQRKVLVVEFKEPGNPPMVNVRIFGTAARMEQAIIDFAGEHGSQEAEKPKTRRRIKRAQLALEALENAGWSVLVYAQPVE